jgi:hypothetical protein
MVQRLLAAMSAGAAWPAAAISHPVWKILRNDAVLAEAEELGLADWQPVFLNAQQNETLIALAERIVPGSTKAQVNRFLDLLLSVDQREHQEKFAESLAAFDAEARKQFGEGFPSLSDQQKDSLLTKAAAGPANVHGSDPHAVERQSPLHKHFENLKGWVSGAYYSSEMGMRELGWTGDYAYETFPGCEHPDGHH